MIPVASILFALGLPAFAIRKIDKTGRLKHPCLFSIGSFMFCFWGIIAEIFTIKRRLVAGDIGGIADTIDSVLMISIGLFVATIILNLLLGLSYHTEIRFD